MRNIGSIGLGPALAAAAVAAVALLVLLAALAAPALAQPLPADFVSAARYDKTGRVTGTIAPDPDGAAGPLKFAAVRNTYDGAGRLIRVEKGEIAGWQSEAVAPAAWTGFTVHQRVDTVHDPMGRKVKESLSGRDPQGLMAIQTVTQTRYDLMGRPECVAVRMDAADLGGALPDACTPTVPAGPSGPDRITRNHYDYSDRLARVRQGVGTSFERDMASYSYNANGKLTSVTDARGFVAFMTWDGHDRQTRWIFPSKTVQGQGDPYDYEEYAWDRNGNRTSFRNRAGETIAYTYDALNRMTLKDRPGTEPDVAYAYDLRGLQRSASFPSTGEAVTNAFDKAGRLVSTTTSMEARPRTLAFQYDAGSNRTRITHPDGVHFDYEHDGLDRVKAIRENGGDPGEVLLATLAYDALGRRISLARGNGNVTTYAYDPGSRLLKQGDDFYGATHDQDVTLAHTPASQIVSRAGSNDLYAYNMLAAGTIATGVDGQNRITASGGAAFAYDSKGNLTSDGVNLYTWTSENLLATVKLPGIAARP